ncbi:MAG TPA: hypothetical protein VEG38_01645 [Acidimicrobiia bacterium]|nr:hypothetical protein [Acidimicrobiia bacterium]
MATIYVCRKCKHSKCLRKELERKTGATIKLIGCQDVCKQPVAGTRVDGRLQWFGGLDRPKRQRALIDLVNDGGEGPVPVVLAKARSTKRAGKAPRS